MNQEKKLYYNRDAASYKNLGGSNLAGIICTPLVKIGLPDLLQAGGGGPPFSPAPLLYRTDLHAITCFVGGTHWKTDLENLT